MFSSTIPAAFNSLSRLVGDTCPSVTDDKQMPALSLFNNSLIGDLPVALQGIPSGSKDNIAGPVDFNCLTNCTYWRQPWCAPCAGAVSASPQPTAASATPTPTPSAPPLLPGPVTQLFASTAGLIGRARLSWRAPTSSAVRDSDDHAGYAPSPGTVSRYTLVTTCVGDATGSGASAGPSGASSPSGACAAVPTASVPVTSALVDGLTPRCAYNVTVFATNQYGNGTAVTVRCTANARGDVAPPAPPTNLTGAPLDSAVNVSWSQVNSTQTSYCTVTSVLWPLPINWTWLPSGGPEPPAPAMHVVAAPLQNGLLYSFSATCFNDAGNATSLTPSPAVRPGPPGPANGTLPGAPLYVEMITVDSVTLSISWYPNVSSSVAGSGQGVGNPEGYVVWLKDMHLMTYASVVVDANDTTLRLGGLVTDRPYHANVTAFNSVGWSPPSATVFGIPRLLYITAPQDVQGFNATDTTVTVTWEAVLVRGRAVWEGWLNGRRLLPRAVLLVLQVQLSQQCRPLFRA